MEEVRCKKCGRVLRSPVSIAMGMGPKCAGISSGSSHRVPPGVRRCTGKAYSSAGLGNLQAQMLPLDLPARKVSRRELVRRQREERRRLFELRQPFQCGWLQVGKTPLVYEPTPDGAWKDASGRVISHERLQSYLKLYQFI